MNSVPAPPSVEGTQRHTVTIPTLDAGELDLSVLRGGEGPPTLLLHGWPQHAGCWRHVIPLLTDSVEVIAPDNRGFGWSDTPGQGYDQYTFSSDALMLMDELGVEQFNVVGHDWGGAAALELALDHPDRVDRLVILNTLTPWSRPSPRMLTDLFGALYGPAMAVFGEWFTQNRPADLARGMRRDVKHSDLFTAADARGYAEVLTQPARAHASKLLYRHYVSAAMNALRGTAPHAGDRLATPTHYLFATGDKAISVELTKGIERFCDDLTIEYTPAAGHFICDELPDLVARRILEHFGLR